MGLRSLKKEQTRQLIARSAQRLFAERGFDRVTVAEVARTARVAPATVFNYFPTKEDLFYSALEPFEERLVDAVRSREHGVSALAAFQRHLMASGGLLAQVAAGDTEALDGLRTVSRVIAGSPALQAREQQAFARHTDALAELLAAETGAPPGDLGPRVAANAMMGVHRALVDYVRRRVLADDRPARLAADAHRMGTDAFALLASGLRDYAARPSAPPTDLLVEQPVEQPPG